jgi:hypothetical protein
MDRIFIYCICMATWLLSHARNIQYATTTANSFCWIQIRPIHCTHLLFRIKHFRLWWQSLSLMSFMRKNGTSFWNVTVNKEGVCITGRNMNYLTSWYVFVYFALMWLQSIHLWNASKKEVLYLETKCKGKYLDLREINEDEIHDCY